MTRSPLAAVAAVVAFLLPCVVARAPACFAAEAGTDGAKAAAYASGWADKSDGAGQGDAFGPWYFTSTPADATHAGYSLGDSRTLVADPDAGPDLNSDGKSFALAGKRVEGQDVEAAVYREFNGGGLSPGQTFAIDLAVNYRNGFKGLDLRAGEEGKGERTTLVNFNVGGDAYTVSSAATGNGPAAAEYNPASRFRLEFKQTGDKGGTWTIKRVGEGKEGGAGGDQATGTYEGVPTGIKLYCSGTDGGKEDVLYFNNLAISN